MGQIFYSMARTAGTQLLMASSARGLVAIHFVSEAGGQEARRRLEAARGPLNLGVERNPYFKPALFSEVRERHRAQFGG